MTELAAKTKWDKAARYFDLMTGSGAEKRWLPAKRALFGHMDRDILFLAAGTGLDFAAFPAGKHITAIDISGEMLKIARLKAANYPGEIRLLQVDVNALAFADASFAQVFTSCTFCSVPDPLAGLEQLYRVLKPGGKLYMFEHTGSRYFPFNMMLNIMSPLSRIWGPEMDRNTVANVERAGFELLNVRHLFLDVVKTIIAVKADH
jgi:ubiquinone/menaquinone biosynthesis C-methylase UbiE